MTSLAVSASLDATYPGGPGSPAMVPWSLALYVSPAEVDGALVTRATSSGRDYVKHSLTTDWFSPTSVIDQIISASSTTTPWPRYDVFAGDWDRATVCNLALGHTAAFEDRVAAHVETGFSHCLDAWSGEAANAASVYFESLARQVRQNADAIRDAAPLYEQISQAISSWADILEGLYAQALDMIWVAAASYALAGDLRRRRSWAGSSAFSPVPRRSAVRFGWRTPPGWCCRMPWQPWNCSSASSVRPPRSASVLSTFRFRLATTTHWSHERPRATRRPGAQRHPAAHPLTALRDAPWADGPAARGRATVPKTLTSGTCSTTSFPAVRTRGPHSRAGRPAAVMASAGRRMRDEIAG